MFGMNRNRSGRLLLLSSLTGILLLHAASASAAPPQGQAAPADVAIIERGKEVFSQTCTGCHGASHTTVQRKPAERWRKTIYTMISRGAPVLPGEVELLTAYLTATYGPSSPLPTLGEGAARLPAELAAGSEVVVRSCSGCHAVNLVFGSRMTQEGWKATVARMRLNGAAVSDSEEQGLLDYLSQYFGPQ